MTNEEIADKLTQGFTATLAKATLDRDPGAIRESNLWSVVNLNGEVIRLTEEKVKAKIERDLATSFDAFQS